VSYVYQLRVLLKTARRFGWDPDATASDEWQPILELAAEKKLLGIARHFSRITKTPAEVTLEEVDRWGDYLPVEINLASGAGGLYPSEECGLTVL
jgi:hypothetical protein